MSKSYMDHTITELLDEMKSINDHLNKVENREFKLIGRYVRHTEKLDRLMERLEALESKDSLGLDDLAIENLDKRIEINGNNLYDLRCEVEHDKDEIFDRLRDVENRVEDMADNDDSILELRTDVENLDDKNWDLSRDVRKLTETVNELVKQNASHAEHITQYASENKTIKSDIESLFTAVQMLSIDVSSLDDERHHQEEWLRDLSDQIFGKSTARK